VIDWLKVIVKQAAIAIDPGITAAAAGSALLDIAQLGAHSVRCSSMDTGG
jgi:hypothetical protein